MHIPETAHLYALLNYAQVSREKYLEPELESYLIQTLLRFSEMSLQDEWLGRKMELDRLKNETELSDVDFLKDIADYCLISSGLMEEHFYQQEYSYEQFQNVGVEAFSMLSEQDDDKENIYIKISQNFFSLVEVLKCSHSIMCEQFTPSFIHDHGTIGDEERSLSVSIPAWSVASYHYQEITYH